MSLDKKHLTACYGCISGCDRQEFPDETGKRYKHFCQSSSFYMLPVSIYYGEGEEAVRVNRLANRLCDQYGLDTAVLQPLIEWLAKCYEAGILGDQETGLPLSKIGSAEFIEKLVHDLSFKEGFGDILSMGALKAAGLVGRGSRRLLGSVISTRASETTDYDPRFMAVNGLIYATEPRRPIQLLHATSLPIARWVNWLNGYEDAFLSTERLKEVARQFWGGDDACDFSTYRGKAVAAKKIQDFGYIKESLILCDLSWPIYQVRHFNEEIGFSTMESRIVSAITGRVLDEDGLNRIGERIFNLQRAILLRQGWGGRESDKIMDYFFEEPLDSLFFDPECLAPGRNCEPISKKGAVVDREGFERLKDEYYVLRGWDLETGLPTGERLRELDLGDVAGDLEKLDLLR